MLIVLYCNSKEKMMDISEWVTASVIIFFALIIAMTGVCGS